MIDFYQRFVVIPQMKISHIAIISLKR